MRKKMLAALAAVAAACSAPALAATETFNFSGACSDCFSGNGNGTGQLVLQDYEYGDQITQDNFVSFHYNGSDLYHAFTLTPDNTFYGFGQIDGPGPASASLGFFGYQDSFLSSKSGFWALGATAALFPADFGPSHSFTLTNAVSAAPEPAAWALMIMGVGIAGTAMRRRQRTTITYA